ncbi:MAG: transglutaminase N-terminal domain-containing protein [Kiloniellales bacterium]
MPRLAVRHLTVYRYRRPVRFGEHRLMFRPRDSHDMRLIDTALAISPRAKVRWLHDVFSNSIAIASFDEPAEELRFESRIELQHYGLENPEFAVEDYASTYPFQYASDEAPDLVRTVERYYPDPERKVDSWAKAFLNGHATVGTQDLLDRVNKAIHQQFAYETRFAIGTQSPTETLARGKGTCRDLALFMMEAVRALGLATRFVSGYLYDPALDPSLNGAGAQALPVGPEIKGGGHTHAWVQIYLPGAGWVEYDPTNGLVGGRNLIRVAVARDPAQALPLHGTFLGTAEDFVDMQVEVSVSRNV